MDNDVYWYSGSIIQNQKDQSTEHLCQLIRVAIKAVTEVHRIGPVPQQYIESFSDIPVAHWPDAFELNLTLLPLLLSRISANQAEGMLTFSQEADSLLVNFWGSPLLVGKFNLPPEFMINKMQFLSQASVSRLIGKDYKNVSSGVFGKIANKNQGFVFIQKSISEFFINQGQFPSDKLTEILINHSGNSMIFELERI